MQQHITPTTTAPRPKPRAQGSTLYQQAIDLTRRRGHTDVHHLADELHISEYRATQFIHRMWDDGVITSQVDMFGACSTREASAHV